MLIRVRKTAICGTDLHIYNWDEWAQKTIPVPMVVGHEFVGDRRAVGTGVAASRSATASRARATSPAGTAATAAPAGATSAAITVGVGVNRPGAFAEYLVIPAENAFKIPTTSPTTSPPIFDPYGNATHTALRFDLVGEDVLITGAGPIGVMAAAIARHVGARHVVITDVNDYRLALAAEHGRDARRRRTLRGAARR